MRRLFVCVTLYLSLSPTAHSQTPGETVRLDVVNYKQLGVEIKNLHGKVILVDFWADYCGPCKQKFPSVQALHRKYAKEGLSVVTVSVDDTADPGCQERVQSFLRQQHATTRNLLLAERPEVWVTKLKMNSIPTMFLFDQQGQLLNRWTGHEIDLGTIERRIATLLNSQPK